MNILIVFLVFLAGLTQPVQTAANKQMREFVQSPILAAFFCYLVGTLILAALAVCGVLGRGTIRAAIQAPGWVWVAGVSGILSITTSLVALGKLSAAPIVAITVFSQLLCSMVLDHFGWLGVPQVSINKSRIIGAVCLFVGALLMQRK
jgi:bacterial/archaeal transporter family-2 protein